MQTDRRESKVAVITGGTSGIGAAAAMRFLREGYRVALCGRQEEKLARSVAAFRQVAGGADCLALAADMSVAADANRFFAHVQDHFGRIDCLVNCAGYAHLARLSELAQEEYESLLRNNLDATFFSCQAAIRYLRVQERGVIVNLSSQAAVDPFAGFAVYGACKAWIEHFTASLARELSAESIAVFAVRPGAVETPMLRSAFPSFPAGEALPPAEVADLIWHLTTPVWRHCTGMSIPVRLS